MELKVALVYTRGLYPNEGLSEIHKALSDAGVHFEPMEVTPQIQASMLDHIIATYHLSPDFWNGVATTYAVDSANKAFTILWRLTKDKIRTMIQSGQKKQLIKKHFIQINRKINKNHQQTFLISNRLSKDVVINGMAKLMKASNKYAVKEPVNDWPFREDTIRLKKDGKMETH